MSSVICDSDAATAAAAAADGSTHLTDSFCCYTHTYTHTAHWSTQRCPSHCYTAPDATEDISQCCFVVLVANHRTITHVG